ncbi:glycine--tRNA ligase subunit beta [Shumkonia mesophila]|uniref:glycine--tRNA ligase subunit beta n=1 Tax=Shumkonia mesophila TaxID=2838854 RepID=UPI002934A564|nr:glycine--tRNA ligase subunit beta [Shumkonia mesophila]
MAELLLELFSEEIPARMQARAADDLKRLVTDGLKAVGLDFAKAEAFVTPRRLTLVVDGLPVAQPDVREERKGPRVGSPEGAIAGFLKAAGIDSLDACEIRSDPKKGDYYVAVVEKKGAATLKVLPAVLAAATAALPWPKSMRWADHAVRWVRPLHSILCLFDGAPVPVAFGPVTAGDATRGHRFLAPAPFAVKDFADYAAKLRAAKVMLDAAERRAVIKAEAEKLTKAEGLTVKADEGLLAEVAGLVEWPVVRMGRIDAAFMDLPPEVLATSMRAHQKYFSTLDAAGKLAPRFVVVANNETADGGAQIVKGNERVLRARLSDAKFFWEQDRKRTLESRVDKLAERIFHAKLGSDRERVSRLRELAKAIARHVPGAEAAAAERAALLCKADLGTEMVGEFPELQGVMGRYYALHDGETPAVADAVAEHYSPQGPGDACPSKPLSVAVALADKIDTLVGFFAIGEKPTGSKDPFALRRAALGVIRLIVENGLRLPLTGIFEAARGLYAGQGIAPAAALDVKELLEFFADRLKVHLREKGVRHDLISAVFAVGGEDDFVRLLARVDALAAFLASEDGADLLTAFRRAANIVRIEEKKDNASYAAAADQALLKQGEEIELSGKIGEIMPLVADEIRRERFNEAMSILARLRGPVDAFFDEVTVNCDEPALRKNRLRLLSTVRSALSEVADFSTIEG